MHLRVLVCGLARPMGVSVAHGHKWRAPPAELQRNMSVSLLLLFGQCYVLQQKKRSRNERAQHPLSKEYSLNHNITYSGHGFSPAGRTKREVAVFKKMWVRLRTAMTFALLFSLGYHDGSSILRKSSCETYVGMPSACCRKG